jgi:formate hydrogenlyase subunit 4
VSATAAVTATVQVVGGVGLAPLLPGAIQSVKARLQGRRGPSPLQPYRDLRKLWGKTAADPQPTTFVYRLAPPLVAAATALALLLVPIAGVAPN